MINGAMSAPLLGLKLGGAGGSLPGRLPYAVFNPHKVVVRITLFCAAAHVLEPRMQCRLDSEGEKGESMARTELLSGCLTGLEPVTVVTTGRRSCKQADQDGHATGQAFRPKPGWFQGSIQAVGLVLSPWDTTF